jgi:8-oxo-dGTP pyrophosphatase MutT (NUDIX family)
MKDLTEADFRSLARQRLRAAPSEHLFDVRTQALVHVDELAADPARAAELDCNIPFRHAAVLVPVVARPSLTVLLTQRTSHLPSHAGQIAFPGGKVEADDADALAAALREAEEEVGLSRSFVEPVGYLDCLRTRTGFHITPVVAIVRPDFSLTIDKREVDDAFEVPLEFLMDDSNHKLIQIQRDGRTRHFYEMPYLDRYIWGVTASVIKNMQCRLLASGAGTRDGTNILDA